MALSPNLERAPCDAAWCTMPPRRKAPLRCSNRIWLLGWYCVRAQDGFSRTTPEAEGVSDGQIQVEFTEGWETREPASTVGTQP